ncbi:MAG: Crp/Fnr family transcriptional regulator [Thermomicrobiales bacterium]|nr:Crp/Fnr family transcriptional regulator [Thermomicrobiales bacterium]
MPAPSAQLSIDILRTVSIFADLPDAALEQLARTSLPRTYRRGQVLCNEGDPGESIYILEEGQLRVTQWTSAGDEAVLAVVEAPAAVGELSLLDGSPRSATLTAVGPVRLRLIPRKAFIMLIQDQPQIVPELLATLATLIRRANVRQVDLLTLDVPGRLAKWLLDRAQRMGTPVQAGIRIDLARSQGELAAEIGTTRPTLNRALRGFEEMGIVAADGQRITILDMDRLKAFTN